ncbi:YceI-like domain-containing protein [Cyclobacterium xiamenense]|uniref:YceI-like domain-containing protein n=1 Tax=Cyclobacterium xiamenense TaxID=1297121 RepID=A0A1H6W245_9BACT|nr:YceI family protein [Cyclobacterium xiamenense]SEJ11008.1 YceI-like domain-containing protein [Cyclobacterium xiamenense]
MKTKSIVLVASFIVLISAAFVSPVEKLVSQKTHISFFSSTPVEDITADNYKATSTLDTSTGDLVFSVPMQSFEFEKALMQKHYNGKDFLDTKSFPKSKFVGKITNLDEVDFSRNGTYEASVSGEMTIKGVTNSVEEKGTILVKDGRVAAESTFDLTLADYGINFKNGKPASNIAKTIEITFKGEY